jgi:hypothetical protein
MAWEGIQSAYAILGRVGAHKDASDVGLTWLSLLLPQNNRCIVFDEPETLGTESERPENSWGISLFWMGPSMGTTMHCRGVTESHRPEGICQQKIQLAQEWKQGWTCTPCSLWPNITWRNHRKAVHNIMLVEDLCATPFLQGRWKCSENLSKSQEFLWGISQQNLSKCAPQSERSCRSKMTAYRLQQTETVQADFTSHLFRLGLFRIRSS